MALLGGRGVTIPTGDEVVVDADAPGDLAPGGAGPALAPRRVSGTVGETLPRWRQSPGKRGL